MELLNWPASTWITLICVLPVLAFTSVFIWRRKDWQAGLRLFLVFSAFIILIVFFPKHYFEIMVALFSVGNFVFICITGMLYWINVNRAGKLKENSVDEWTKMYTKAGILFLGLGIVGFLINDYSFSRSTILLPMLFAGNYLGKTFLSFQIRERGIISRGKYIKFENVNSMRWVNLRNKDEVEYTLKDSAQPQRLKIPWKLIIPMDNYMGAHFPRVSKIADK